MRNAAAAVAVSLLATPALAHPGSATEHEVLGTVGHLALSASPFVVAAVLVGLALLAVRRRS